MKFASFKSRHLKLRMKAEENHFECCSRGRPSKFSEINNVVRRRSWIRGEVSGGREKGEPQRRNERAEDDRESGRAVDSCRGVGHWEKAHGRRHFGVLQ